MRVDLPKVKLGIGHFYVDVDRNALVSVEAPSRIIKLRSCQYDPESNTYGVESYHPAFHWLVKRGSDEDEFNIPGLTQMAPEQFVTKYGKSIQDIRGCNDAFVVTDQDALYTRKDKGVQPRIYIKGALFFVNLHLGRLERDLEKPSDLTNIIEFRNIDHWRIEESRTTGYIIPFDVIKKRYVDYDYSKITEWPSQLKLVHIPDEETLDPVGYCRETGWGLEESLRWHPIVMERNARVVPLKTMCIPQVIAENIEKANRRSNRPRKFRNEGPAKGKGRV